MTDSAGPDNPSTSSDAPRVLVVVCTFNEMENLPELLERVRHAIPTADALVVDDHSPDGTGQWADEQAATDPQLHVLIRTNERGLGSALRAGMQFAIERRYDFVMNLDGDLSHQPEDLPRLLAAARSTDPPTDVVVGSRYVSSGRIEGWPIHRKVMSRMVNSFATRMLRLPVKDCSGALRCYRTQALQRIDFADFRCDGYAMLEELLLLLHRNGATFDEIPITFTDRQQGSSKLTMKETLRSVRSLLRMLFR